MAGSGALEVLGLLGLLALVVLGAFLAWRQWSRRWASLAAATDHRARPSSEAGSDSGSGSRSDTDGLTGLWARSVLVDQVGRALREAHREGRSAAVALVDLDGFKQVNDTLGHDAGDRVLAEVGRRVRAVVEREERAVRLGGDEFAVLLVADDGAGLDRRAAALVEALMHPVAVDEVLLTVTPSVGLAERGRDGDALGDLLRAADAAMYDAKRAGATVRRVRTSVTGTTLTAADLEQALARDELVVHYQPQVADADGAVTSFEALVRWNHPERGLLLPEEFLDLAERSPVIGPMTQWVVHRASSDLPALRRAAPGCSVSVNVSARILLRHRVVDELAAILRSTGTDPAQLVLEITEPAPRATPEVQGLLEQTRELGCRVSVHGFGSAQASVTALWQYPAVGEIKLDPAIVRAVGHDAQAERLCRAITSAAHGLDLRVVAEGVESSDVVPVLRRLGCDAYQGFLVGRPMPVDAVPAWVEDWQLGGSTLLR